MNGSPLTWFAAIALVVIAIVVLYVAVTGRANGDDPEMGELKDATGEKPERRVRRKAPKGEKP